MTNTLVSVFSPYMESAQQGFSLKARELHKGLLELGAIYADGMLKEERKY